MMDFFNCSCCENRPIPLKNSSDMFWYCFDLFARCMKDNESLQIEFSEKVKEILIPLNDMNENNQMNQLPHNQL